MAREPVLKCYRGSCDSAAHPCGYNRITHGLYCIPCAKMIDRFNKSHDFYPLLPFVNRVTEGGMYQTGLIVIRQEPPTRELWEAANALVGVFEGAGETGYTVESFEPGLQTLASAMLTAQTETAQLPVTAKDLAALCVKVASVDLYEDDDFPQRLEDVIIAACLERDIDVRLWRLIELAFHWRNDVEEWAHNPDDYTPERMREIVADMSQTAADEGCNDAS